MAAVAWEGMTRVAMVAVTSGVERGFAMVTAVVACVAEDSPVAQAAVTRVVRVTVAVRVVTG